jgi:hypothetical protein
MSMVSLELPQDLCGYIFSALFACLFIRLFLSFLRWTEGCAKPPPQPPYWVICIGFKAKENTNDYLQPFLVGFLELLVYPVLLAGGAPEYIGAWLGFKVVPKLGSWSTHRETYQRFLIGNALVVILSFFLQKYFYA